MPRPIGQPITVTNGQPQREVARFQTEVLYDPDGTPRFQFQAFTVNRLRDAQGAIIWQGEHIRPLVNLVDAQIPAALRTSFTAILTRLDQIADPA